LSDRLVALAQEGFDLAIRHTPAPPETHVAWALAPTHSVLVASRDYLARRGTPAAPAELAGHDCLHYLRAGEHPAWQLVPQAVADTPAAAAAQKLTVPITGPLATNNSEALREAALRGLGIALLPDFSAQAALRSGALQPVLPGWRPVGSFGEHLWAIRPYSPYVPRAVQALVAWLRGALAGGFAAG
jgi:DNA-binding transcriptional LysR family regulator